MINMLVEVALFILFAVGILAFFILFSNYFCGTTFSLTLTLPVLGILFAFIFIGFIFAWLVHRADPLKVIMTGGAVLLLGIIISGYTIIQAGFLLGVFLDTVGTFMLFAASYSIISQMAPPEKMGTFIGLMAVPTLVGSYMGAWVHSMGTETI